MNTATHSAASRPTSPAVNPFAQAMETARGGMGTSPFSTDTLHQPDSNIDPLDQQRRFKEEQQKERRRLELFREINPINKREVFSAKEQDVKKELEEIRHEVYRLVNETKLFQHDMEVAVMGGTPNPGLEGKGAKGFWQKFREWVITLRELVQSARETFQSGRWSTTLGGKKSKQGIGQNQKQKQKGFQMTSTVHNNNDNNELNMHRSGG